jgi:ABC-type transport system involved in cytochrome bd biosynthesis fused ATPase/permease subunit
MIVTVIVTAGMTMVMSMIVIAGGTVHMFVRVIVGMVMAVIVMMVASLAMIVSVIVRVIVVRFAMVVLAVIVASARWRRGFAAYQADYHTREDEAQEKNAGQQHWYVEELVEHQAQRILPPKEDAYPAQQRTDDQRADLLQPVLAMTVIVIVCHVIPTIY